MENAACVLSCEIGRHLKRFKARLMYVTLRVLSLDGHYFGRLYGMTESHTVPVGPRYSGITAKEPNSLT